MGTIVELPSDGYILSGHGSGADFIKNNLQIGNKVEITNVEIKFYKDFLMFFPRHLRAGGNFTLVRI